MIPPRLRISKLWTRVTLSALVLLSMLVASTFRAGVTASKTPPAASAPAISVEKMQGKFSPVIRFQHKEDPSPFTVPVMVHASLLPNGKVLFWGRDKETDASGETINDVVRKSTARVWDRGWSLNPDGTAKAGEGHFQVVDNGTTNLFCTGHSLLPDGRLFAAGGHAEPHPYSKAGDRQTNIFNPVTNAWAPQGPGGPPVMPKGRWYPFSLVLEDGKVAILSGSYAEGGAYPKQHEPEIYDPQTNSLELKGTLAGGAQTVGELPLYPYLFLDPVAPGVTNPHRGVFVAGPTNSFFWNPKGGPDGKGSRSAAASHGEKHHEGSAVMYDSDEGWVLVTGGRTGASYQPVTRVAKRIRLNQPEPVWEQIESMKYPRTFHTLTLLPDGKVLAAGGVPCNKGHITNPCDGGYSLEATKTLEMWDPAERTWVEMATGAVTRAYHSTAMLLPDATVLIGGGGLPVGATEKDGKVIDDLSRERHTAGERNVEIYYPPYLFDDSGNRAPQPVIHSAPTEVGYGRQFGISYGNAASVTRVAWVRLPSVTHGFNTDQRINVLQHTATPGVAGHLTVTTPSDPRKCPPGHYMLFIFDEKKTPSVAKIVKIHQPAHNPEDYIGRRVVTHNDRVHVFYRHIGDLKLHYVVQSGPDTRTFNPPLEAGGTLGSNPLAIHNANGLLEVFVLGTDNKLYSARQSAVGSNSWTWRALGATSSLPAIAVARNQDGRIQVFYRGSDNALWYVAQTAPNSAVWTQPSSLGGGLASEPAVAMNADGGLQVFVRGTDNALWSRTQTLASGNAWSDWSSLGGGLTAAPFAAANKDGRLSVFVRGTDYAVHHIRQQAPNGTSWSAFQSLGGSVRSDHPYNSPVAALTPDGRVQLFVRWQDNTLRTLVQDSPNGGFPAGSWFSLGGSLNATISPPARSADGRFFMAVRAAGTDLYINTQTAPNGYELWDGFTYLGDAAHSF